VIVTNAMAFVCMASNQPTLLTGGAHLPEIVKKQEAFKNCPKGHLLVRKEAPMDESWCDVCHATSNKGDIRHGCKKCNYDECEKCYAKVANDAAPSLPKATTDGGRIADHGKASTTASPFYDTAVTSSGQDSSQYCVEEATEIGCRDYGTDVNVQLTSPSRRQQRPKLPRAKTLSLQCLEYLESSTVDPSCDQDTPGTSPSTVKRHSDGAASSSQQAPVVAEDVVLTLSSRRLRPKLVKAHTESDVLQSRTLQRRLICSPRRLSIAEGDTEQLSIKLTIQQRRANVDGRPELERDAPRLNAVPTSPLASRRRALADFTLKSPRKSFSRFSTN